MFTGIIETLGQVKDIVESGTNKTFWIESPLSGSFSIDQSIAHDGVCLTVEEIQENRHRITAISETLQKTTLGDWDKGKIVNLELSLLPTKRLDGHFVQGHVDTTATCDNINDKHGSWEFTFSFSKDFAPLIIEKGSIAINGVSLTLFDVKRDTFKVAIIPYTYNHTNLKDLEQGSRVNVEFDLVGKYILRKLQVQ